MTSRLLRVSNDIPVPAWWCQFLCVYTAVISHVAAHLDHSHKVTTLPVTQFRTWPKSISVQISKRVCRYLGKTKWLIQCRLKQLSPVRTSLVADSAIPCLSLRYWHTLKDSTCRFKKLHYSWLERRPTAPQTSTKRTTKDYHCQNLK